MQLSTTYKQIFYISFPIMLGSAVQNIIVLCDNLFLLRLDSTDFAAIGVVGSFYLVLASIGYGFSRGGQILMARKYGSLEYSKIGSYFQSLVLFELLMAVSIFGIIQLFSDNIFSFFIKDKLIIEKCLAYIYPRSYGLFFSYLGVALISLYTAVARPKIILYDTIILMIANVLLSYILIFGKLGFKPMGIEGAAWANTIAEVIAFGVFIVYMIFDKKNRDYKLTSLHWIDFNLIKQSFSISFPIVIQSFFGLGAYFLFFAFIENTGKRNLEISNLIRNIYLILSIPAWGYSAGINTIVSNFIGNQKRQAVMPMIYKTALLCTLSTLVVSLPILFLPEYFLAPLFGDNDPLLLADAKPYFHLLLGILIVFSIGSIYFNGLIGTGHTQDALVIQISFTVLYCLYCFLIIKTFSCSLGWAWSAELIYWGGILLITNLYLKSKRWYVHKI